MTAAAMDSLRDWDDLLKTWRDLDVPEGWRAEIIDGDEITMTPSPLIPHNRIVAVLHRALAAGTPDEWEIHQTTSVVVPAVGRLYIPDLCVIPAADLNEAGEGPEVDAESLMLAVEVVSDGKRAKERDRKLKRWGCAHGPVPIYLLVDRFDDDGPTVTVFAEPSGGRYRRERRTPFGEPVTLPAPFDLTLETKEFPTDR